jgi:hypothetical protein
MSLSWPALGAPLRITLHWETDPPPTLAWVLRNDRLIVALAAATTAPRRLQPARAAGSMADAAPRSDYYDWFLSNQGKPRETIIEPAKSD